MRLLDVLVTYLGDKLELEPGTNILYNGLLEEPSYCMDITALKPSSIIPAQVDAAVHNLRITARDDTDAGAHNLALNGYRWLRSDSQEFDNDSTGFVTLADDYTVSVQLYGEPIWEKTDQQGRRYYTFALQIITKRLI